MTNATIIAKRFVEKKIPNELAHGERVYSVSVEELSALIRSVQLDAQKSGGNG